MAVYIDQSKKWPEFRWDNAKLAYSLAHVRYRHGRLLGRMEVLGVPAYKPGGSGQEPKTLLTYEQIRRWHADLYPDQQIGGGGVPGAVGSGKVEGFSRRAVHYETSAGKIQDREMQAFLRWFNTDHTIDPVLKAAVAEIWFIHMRPFADGNTRIGRNIADRQLAHANGGAHLFYSMTDHIATEGNSYLEALEAAGKNQKDITAWLEWFLACLDRTIDVTDKAIEVSIRKARFWDRHEGQSFNDRQKRMLHRLLEGHSVSLTSSFWARTVQCSPDTAVRDINELVERGILMKEAAGGRSTRYGFLFR